VSLAIQCEQRQGEVVRLRCEIRDTGIGVPEAKIPYLFEPFYQVDHFMTRKETGTGLGLAICKKLVQLLGGDIWYEQGDERSGSLFTFTIQCRIPQAAEQPATFSAGGMERRSEPSLNILIAEDNPVNQLVLSRTIAKLGYSSAVVSNGAEAVEAVLKTPYDLVFMDIQMPIMDGAEAAATIKAALGDRKAPYIVAVTAHAIQGDRDNYISSGMDDYVSKPISIDAISSVMERYLSLERDSSSKAN
jgi:CheY-like chemotaxis protein